MEENKKKRKYEKPEMRTERLSSAQESILTLCNQCGSCCTSPGTTNAGCIPAGG